MNLTDLQHFAAHRAFFRMFHRNDDTFFAENVAAFSRIHGVVRHIVEAHRTTDLQPLRLFHHFGVPFNLEMDRQLYGIVIYESVAVVEQVVQRDQMLQRHRIRVVCGQFEELAELVVDQHILL